MQALRDLHTARHRLLFRGDDFPAKRPGYAAALGFTSYLAFSLRKGLSTIK
jgi:hypothetical protein